ncbi:hypothetical protein B0T26DRAFT_756602 [Lasiosphaeria miniovina]|uniref:Uncharacterized protein n=1 Tax=Lasiosphaeria miniovina TaxID=1954250 RepID=A0AA40DJH1_9PEZI|nr:uncharacterized protein B0T26DRAFT_756602 [Lasiosphaeria miniovina]KAK0703012.1 hypothetical protein B0T26DRAFT_756602 [Lasiosphaeria miniovina]
MSEKHGFTATKRQYKYRFPGLKNVKEDEWAYIEDEIRSRDALGKLFLLVFTANLFYRAVSAVGLLASELLDQGSLNSPRAGAASSNNLVERRKVLSDLLGSPAQSFAELATQFQGFIPERREGDLSEKLERIVDTSSPATSALPALFALTAFFASNNSLDKTKMDEFLRWIINNQYLAFLQRFIQLQIPTVHAFTKYVFESAIRIKSIPVLSEPLDRGVDFGSVAEDIDSIGDHDFTRRVLAKMDSKYFKNDVGGRLFHRFVSAGLFDLAKFLLDKGVSVEARDP